MILPNFKKIEKVVVNVGIGRESQKPGFSDKILPSIMNELALITGQKPQTRTAKRSISGFKSREGQVIGLKVTLHGRRAYDFLSRVINAVLPRVRDFRGLEPKNVDLGGNLNLGIRDHLTFPEISPESSKASFGLQVTVVLKDVKSREASIELFRSMGVPLKK